jgi:hypothetical protein
MKNALPREIPTGVDEPAWIEWKETDRKAQTESEKWAWQVHEVALHEGSQRNGVLKLGCTEPLLKKVSEEVTRKAQQRLTADALVVTPLYMCFA